MTTEITKNQKLQYIIDRYEVSFKMETLSNTAKFRLDLEKTIEDLLNIVNQFEKVEEIELFVGSTKFIGRKQYNEIVRKDIEESILIKEDK